MWYISYWEVLILLESYNITLWTTLYEPESHQRPQGNLPLPRD